MTSETIGIINSIAKLWWWDWAGPMLFQAGIVIAIVATVDFLIRRWAWPQVRYALWLLVLVKLVLPPTFTSPASFTAEITVAARQAIEAKQVLPEPETGAWQDAVPVVPAEITAGGAFSGDTASIDTGTTGSEATDAEAIETSGGPRAALSREAYGFLVWVMGVLVLAGWLVFRLRSLRKEGLADVEPGQLPEWFEEVLTRTAGRLKLRRVPEVVLSKKVKGPAVFGLFRPVVLMPAERIKELSKTDAEYILLHELAHIKRADLWVHAGYVVLQIVYWFNPLVWLIRRQLQDLRELCCDATVARILREKTLNYRETLLETARELLAERVEAGLGLLGLFENSNRLVDRLNWLEKKTWKRRGLRIAVILALVAVMIGCVLPMAKFDPGSPGLTIKGSVTDAMTGQPIAGARIFDDPYGPGPDWQKIESGFYEPNLPQWGAITDANGEYAFLTWHEHHSFKVEADGYKPDRGVLYSSHFSIPTKDIEIFDFALEPEKTAEKSDPKFPEGFAGHWRGQAKIIVNWTKQRWLPIDIVIKPDGTVSGQVGDSQLKNAGFKLHDWLTRKFNPGNKWMIRGDLIGPVIKKENIEREYINLLFNNKLDADGKIKGGFNTSGWHIGGKKTMVMSGTKMVLERVGDVPDGHEEPPGSKLEFRILPVNLLSGSAPGPLRLENEIKYRKDFQKNGPDSARRRGDEYIWLEVEKYELSKYSPLVIEKIGEKSYILAANLKNKMMLADGSWGLQRVYPGNDYMGRPAVKFEFDSRGSLLLYKLTRSNINNRLAIIIDGKIYSAPTINSAVRGHGVIPGTFSETEVKELVGMLSKGMPAVVPRAKGQQPGFEPTIEITINDSIAVKNDSLIDFDTGKLFSLPDDWGKTYDDNDKALQWIISNGLDAFGATRNTARGLDCEGMIFMSISNSYWDNFRADSLATFDLWEKGKPGRPAHMTGKGKLPTTYIFKTREGGIGILQITGFNDEPRGVNIRYKILQEP